MKKRKRYFDEDEVVDEHIQRVILAVRLRELKDCSGDNMDLKHPC
jgi:hypothetical protein